MKVFAKKNTMKEIKWIGVTILLIVSVWLFFLNVPRWVPSTILSVVIIVVMYIFYKMDKSKM